MRPVDEADTEPLVSEALVEKIASDLSTVLLGHHPQPPGVRWSDLAGIAPGLLAAR